MIKIHLKFMFVIFYEFVNKYTQKIDKNSVSFNQNH